MEKYTRFIGKLNGMKYESFLVSKSGYLISNRETPIRYKIISLIPSNTHGSKNANTFK